VRVVDAASCFPIGTDPWSDHYRPAKGVNCVEQPMGASFHRALVQPHDGDASKFVVRSDDHIYVYVNDEHVIDIGDVAFMDATGFGFATRSTVPRFNGMVIDSGVQGEPNTDFYAAQMPRSTSASPRSASLSPGGSGMTSDGRTSAERHASQPPATA